MLSSLHIETVLALQFGPGIHRSKSNDKYKEEKKRACPGRCEFTLWSEKWIPDSFIFCLSCNVSVLGIAMISGMKPPTEIVSIWEKVLGLDSVHFTDVPSHYYRLRCRGFSLGWPCHRKNSGSDAESKTSESIGKNFLRRRVGSTGDLV